MKLLYCILLCLISTGLFAQKHSHNRAKIDSAKAVFINQRLSLTEDQFRKFWPVYPPISRQETSNKKALRSYREAQNAAGTTDNQLVENYKSTIQLKKEELAIEENYLNKLLAVLTQKQIADLLKAESEFIGALRKRMHEKK